jgi:hypothetical protein
MVEWVLPSSSAWTAERPPGKSTISWAAVLVKWRTGSEARISHPSGTQGKSGARAAEFFRAKQRTNRLTGVPSGGLGRPPPLAARWVSPSEER